MQDHLICNVTTTLISIRKLSFIFSNFDTEILGFLVVVFCLTKLFFPNKYFAQSFFTGNLTCPPFTSIDQALCAEQYNSSVDPQASYAARIYFLMYPSQFSLEIPLLLPYNSVTSWCRVFFSVLRILHSFIYKLWYISN